MFHVSSHIRRIGLIADSHGNLPALQRSTEVLVQKNVDLILHLGDFCDSVYHEELAGIIDLIHRMRIQVVKGNNDYQVEKMLENGYSNFQSEDKRRWLSFLKNVPITFELGSICFAHSLPYNTIRSFYEPVDTGSTDRAIEVFKHTNYQLLFCGHSHVPLLFRYKAGRVTREPMTGRNRVGIESDQRYIFIIGSADDGECGIFDLTESRYERFRI